MILSPNYAIAVPNVLTPIPASGTIAATIGLISAALQLGGWLLDATLSNGFRFLGSSPQGYSVLLEVTWQTTGISSVPNTIGWQLKSAVSTGSVGVMGWSLWDTSSVYQIVTFPCGWFFSRPGMDTDATCGGIPYSPYGALIGAPSPPAECNMGTVAASEIYWSMAQNGPTAGVSGRNPRASLDLDYGGAASGGGLIPSSSGCQTGVVVPAAGGVGDPQILRLSSTFYEGTSYPSGVSQPIWYSGADMAYPAFIAWGPNNSSAPLIRGQLYNAVCRTGKYAIERMRAFDGYTWSLFTDSYYFGSLWVLRGAGQLGNFGFSN